MLTPTEMAKLLDQVNTAFTEDRARLKALEVKVADLIASLPAKAPKIGQKNVE